MADNRGETREQYNEMRPAGREGETVTFGQNDALSGTKTQSADQEKESRRKLVEKLDLIVNEGGDEREKLHLLRDVVNELSLGPLSNELISLISRASDSAEQQTIGVCELGQIAVQSFVSEERMIDKSTKNARQRMEGIARQTKEWARDRVERQEEVLEDLRANLAQQSEAEVDIQAKLEALTRQIAALEQQNCYWRDEANRAMQVASRAKGPHMIVDPPSDFGFQPLVGEIDKMRLAKFIFPGNGSFSGQADSRMTVERYLSNLTKAQNSLKLTRADFEDKLCAGASGPAQTTIENALRRGLSLEAIYTTLLEKYSKRETPEQAEAKLAAYMPVRTAKIGEILDHIGGLAWEAASQFDSDKVAQAIEEHLIRRTILRVLPPSASTSLKLKLFEADQRVKLTRDELITEILSLKDFLDGELTNHNQRRKAVEDAEY